MTCMAICTIEGCGRVQRGSGYCNKHWFRWKRYGDPLAGGPWKGGELARFAEDIAAKSNTDDCVIWPYGRDGNGYSSMLTVNGSKISAHRYICKLANGDPGIGDMALHSCGNGQEGCVNPRHLRWGRHAENYRDSLEHGTAALGEKHHCARLSDRDFRQIIELRSKETARETAERFGITMGYVYQVRGGHGQRASRIMQEAK